MYGSLEGYLTAKALVMALQLASPNPTRASYVPGDHRGLTLVGLLIYRYEKDDRRFRH